MRTAVLDTTDEAAVEAFFATAGQFDHVVISAVQRPGGPVRQLQLSDAYAAMNSKFWGAYRVARVVKIAEGGLVFLLTVHLLGGLRVLVIENFDWHDGQKQLATLAAAISAAVAFVFLVRVF